MALRRISIPSVCRLYSCASFRYLQKCYSTDDQNFKIYTKTGDKGTSATLLGDRRPKDDDIFNAVGTTDELSSAIGLAKEFAEDNCHLFVSQLEEIQCALQDIGSNIAAPRQMASDNQLRSTAFEGSRVELLEEWIDEHTDKLPPLKNFILPSGGKTSSSLHIARSVCRRAERSVVPLVREGNVDDTVGRYLNRLSDYLFTVARLAAKDEGKVETIYRRPRKRRNPKK
ncbi:corrinoid adenosyltransferase-like [Anneissia japonica]|uniref:corrinoid adenosyltransferase-like n=1 Tax=Anneissia japonica TaxID=1529436 RepID=UPI001425987B|nr:corrinoid adenosyltransferase-like [Anneissia japonica]